MDRLCVSRMVLLFAFSMFAALPVYADVILWDSGVPNGTGMWPSSSREWVIDPEYPDTQRFHALEIFTLPEVRDPYEPVVVTGVHWWGYEILPEATPAPMPTATLEILFLYSDVSSFDHYRVDSVPVYTGEFLVLQDGSVAYLFEYDFDVATLLFAAADRQYLIDIYASDASNWAWAESNVDGLHGTNISPGTGGAEDTPGDLAFYLRGTYHAQVIPEPVTLLLVGIGLAGTVLRHALR